MDFLEHCSKRGEPTRLSRETGLAPAYISRVKSGAFFPNVYAAVMIGIATDGMFGPDYWAARQAEAEGLKPIPKKKRRRKAA